MTNQSTAAVYGSYNARSVLPEKVATTFVPPDQFWRILPQSNAVITGPRGSGKTTLLKMLTAAALEHWEHARAEEARAAVGYTGVFVPADRSWAGQLERTARPLDEDLRSDLGRAAFTLHVLRALAGAALYRTIDAKHPRGHHKLPGLSREVQDRIARAVSRPWGLPGAVGSFESLRWALSEEITELGRLARRASRSPATAHDVLDHPALDIDVIDAAGLLIDRVNDIDGEDGHVWMLLIDEIEFLPSSAREFLLEAMRGRDPRIMQKVSLAPYTETERDADHALGGWSGHDYEHIDLTFADKESGYRFSRALFEQELADRNLPLDVDAFLSGPGYFEQPPGSYAYVEGSRNARAIASLAAKDDAFCTWLRDHTISVERLEELTPDERAATLRKAMPVILIREEFLAAAGRRRSRKNPTLYTGSRSIFAICENNPRLLKALAQRLIDRRDKDGKLAVGAQAETVTDACNTYFRHLRAIEIADAGLPDDYLPRALVQRIGDYFEMHVLGERFSPEPALSVTLAPGEAEELHPALEHILNALINYGALIPLGDPEEHRFGLSHMFAPRYRLPLRRGRAVSLTKVLSPPLRPEPDPASKQEQLKVDDAEGAR
jgi:energy-coupling factor transporter ATP-binding protein EcfA2